MFYVIVKNLDVERCIHKNEADIYVDGMALRCTTDLGCSPGTFVREVHIICTELPGELIKAEIYRDP